MQILDCVQGSDEWFAARIGIPTASNFDKIITTKGEPSKQALKYMYKLAAEKASGQKEDGYQSDDMARGVELENYARSAYEFAMDVNVVQVGFCLADGYGASPDGMIGDEGLVEIKCPKPSTHVEYLESGKLPTTYFQQVQGQLLVTERKWCDFVSYCPGLKPLIIRVDRNDDFINKLKAELEAFNEKLNALVQRISE